MLAPADLPLDVGALVRAALLVDPDAIVVGAGARSLGWAGTPVMPLELASSLNLRASTPYLRFTQRVIPPEFVVDRGQVRLTTPEFTAVDLIPRMGGDVVDEVLRMAGDRGPEALALMWDALRAQPNRRGNAERRRLLHASRGRPWSGAERQLHALLRSWGYHDWEANHCVVLSGRTWFIDVAFPASRVALEFDSWQHHGSRQAFENDRLKANELRAADWKVLQITWSTLNKAHLRRWLRRMLE